MITKNILTIRMAFSKAVIIVFVTAISIVFVTGVFNVTQAQEEEQGQ
jgi:Na+-translocating ferredoxin:NAD+ oxidoreductase RnfG subunit